MVEKINWAEVEEEQVNPSMKRRMVYGENIMVTKMRFKDGFVVPLHHHENEQVTEVISGSGSVQTKIRPWTSTPGRRW